MQEIGMLAGLALGGFGLFLLAWRTAHWQRKAAASRTRSPAASEAQPAPGGAPQPAAADAAAGPDPLLRRLERRMEEIEAVQADLAERLAEVAEEGSAQKLQSMAGSLVTLVRDKNATMETALAGLDGMRARLKTLEAIGDLAEARALFEGLKGRIEALEAAQARTAEAREAEARAAEARAADIRGLERRVAEIGAAAEARDAERRAAEAREIERRAAEASERPGALAEIGEALARLHEQKEAAVETVFARLGPLEAKLAGIEGRMAGLDPQGALDRFAERLEAVRQGLEARLEAAEAAGAEAEAAAAARAAQESAVAEITGALARLHAQKDATAETVFARLAPLEEKLAGLEGRLSGFDPQAAFERFAERLDAARAALQAQIDPLRADREQSALAQHAFAEIAGQLAQLQSQKEAAVETVLGRIGPLEVRLRELEDRMAGLDPEVALARFGERLAAVQARVAALDGVEVRLGALDAVGERLDTLDGMRERLGAIEAGGAAAREAVAAIAAEFDRLKERAGAGTEAALARLAPLEAQLAAMEVRLGERDPGPALARIDERLGALGERMAELEAASREAERPSAALFERVAAMQAEREAALAEVMARLGPLEARLTDVESIAAEGLAEGEAARDAVAGMAGEIAGLRAELRAEMQAEVRAAETMAREASLGLERLAALQDAGARAGEERFAAFGERLAELQGERQAAIGAILARVGALEEKLGGVEVRMDECAPQAALAVAEARMEARLDGLRERMDALEEGGMKPFAEIADRLAGLHAQKDAGIERVMTRLEPLEHRLGAVEGCVAGMDPTAALDRFAERLEAARAGLQGQIDAMRDENPFAEVSERLTRLYAQKDAVLETVFGRLAPLEAKLGEMEVRLRGMDPTAALDRFAERLEAAQAGLQGQIDAMREENPLAEVNERLAQLYSLKDATLEAVLGWLAPLEAKLAEVEARLGGMDPTAALDRFAERLEAARAGLQGQIDDLREENPFAEITDQLVQLYAQKDAAVETVFGRLAPLEAKLGEIEARLGEVDPRDALGQIGERLEAIGARIAAVEAEEDPYAEITERLTELHARKDAAVEAVFARLGPIEAKLDGVEARVGALDPQAALARFAERVEAAERAQSALAARMGALADPGGALAQIRMDVAGLREQRDAALGAVNARLAGLERALADVEARGLSEAEARAEAQAIAAQMIATRTVAEETQLFASRLSLLEASLPRLSLSQSLMMQALERQAVPWDAGLVAQPALPAPAAEDAPEAAARTPHPPEAGCDAAGARSAELPEVWSNPRVVSLHHSGS